MKSKRFNQIYSMFLVFLLSISLITTPLQTFVSAEGLDNNEDVEMTEEDKSEETIEGKDNQSSDETEQTEEKADDNDEDNNEKKSDDNKEEESSDITEETKDTKEETIDVDYSDFEVVIDEDATTTTSNSITIEWSVNHDIVEEFILSLDDEEVERVSSDTFTYTFEDLNFEEGYNIEIEAVTKDDEVSSYDSIWEETFWSQDELTTVSFVLLFNDDPGYDDYISIRGLDDSNKHFEFDDEEIIWLDDDIELPLGKYEVVIYDEEDPSISAREEFEIKDGVNYVDNPIQLKYRLKEMREDAEPLEYNVTDVTENSFTLAWNAVSKITGIKIDAWDNKGEYQEVTSGSLDKNTTEFTLDGLNPDLIYQVEFLADYIYDLNKWENLVVKTDGEHAKDDKIDFENDALHQSVKDEIGLHLRGATVADMEDLTYLSSNNNDITTLKGLEKAKHLKELELYSNEISDISELKDLIYLESLDLDYNNIPDISVLEHLTKLKSLDLDYNNISDISPLKDLSQLSYLRLSENNISDISALENLTSLYSLGLSYNQISNLSYLKDLTELTYLSLSENNISDITPLENLTNLYTLELSYNNISEISSLKGLTGLWNLDLDDNNISDISALKSLVNLYHLDLHDNNISNISALESLTRLEEVNLAYNNISNISSLKSLTNLEDLYLNNNNISELPSLESMKSLTELYLWENQISDISSLAGLDNLTELDLDNNNITDISVLKELPSLQYVSLYGNDIDDEETIQWLLNDGVEVYYDNEDDDWNDWEDENENEDWDFDEVNESFPAEDGFVVNEDGSGVSLDLSKQNKNEPFKLTKEQTRVLIENGQSINLSNKGVQTSIPSSAFDNYDEPVEISVNELKSEPNSLSSTYDFTIKQGTRTISEFDDGVTLTFNVNAARAKNPNNMKVFFFNEETKKWENIGGTYHKNSGTVSVVTAHFSTFTVFEAEDESSDETVTPKPETPSEPEGTEEDPEDDDDSKDDNTNIDESSTNDDKIDSSKDNDTAKDNEDNLSEESTDKDNIVINNDDNSSKLLPDTATDNYNILLIGFLFLLAGGSILLARYFYTRTF